jgi:hypothetical protein
VGFEASDTLPCSPVGRMDIEHTHEVGTPTDHPGDIVDAQLVNEPLQARRLTSRTPNRQEAAASLLA